MVKIPTLILFFSIVTGFLIFLPIASGLCIFSIDFHYHDDHKNGGGSNQYAAADRHDQKQARAGAGRFLEVAGLQHAPLDIFSVLSICGNQNRTIGIRRYRTVLIYCGDALVGGGPDQPYALR